MAEEQEFVFATPAVLLRAAELVEQGWTQGQDACLSNGTPCTYSNDEAVRWCANGAIYRSAYERWGDRYNESTIEADAACMAMKKAVLAAALQSITEWNDVKGRTAGEVAAKLREAAAGISGP